VPLYTELVSEADEPPKKVVLLGSGGLSIGQAGEFDYSGTQALRALLAEGLEVIVVNPNIATVQTNPGDRIKVYLYPVTAPWVVKVFAKERPDAIVAGFGGQTALSCLLDLDEGGYLEQYEVKNLGTSPQTLRLSEDRKQFAEKMRQIGIPTPPSVACCSVEEAVLAASEIGYPVICRMAYALGGLGSGFARHHKELVSLVEEGLAHSPQVLVEKSLKGWKEVEYEVMRDGKGNAICICNMENFDPLGIHTGDSIVVCPSQTLSDSEYQFLRDSSLRVVEALGVLGECNAQFALSPDSLDYYIIEVNARLSRSSALASKASGYPIAYVAACVVCGYDLLELKNPVTLSTSAFFEPALDYITLKVPRWDLVKFKGAHRELGSTMKSVGEIMAIGRTFREALQKAVRSIVELGPGISWFNTPMTMTDLASELEVPTDRRLYAICQAFRQDVSLDEVFERTRIDRWFLRELLVLVRCEQDIFDTFSHLALGNVLGQAHQEGSVEPSFDNIMAVFCQLGEVVLRQWKGEGFSDEQLVYLAYMGSGGSARSLSLRTIEQVSLQLRALRKKLGVLPVAKKIDTTAAEYPTPSNYLYMTYHGTVHDPLEEDVRPSALIVGGGAYRIGTSVEFDWCAVSCSKELRANGWSSVMINCNPETVSTDYNESDRLYFEEITLERILDICDHVSPQGVIASMGGQLPNKLALSLASAGVKLLGHSASSIDMAEDRSKFSAILDELGIDQPRWISAKTAGEIEDFIAQVGFPLLVRPSYVLSGAAMKVAYNKELLSASLSAAGAISSDHPVVLSEFLSGACEIEVDGVAHGGKIIISIVSEHIEHAGTHSGDATTVVPAQKLYVETVRQVKKAARMIAERLGLNGPFNMQFLAQNNHIKVIECNARAARSFPFISKVVGAHLASIACDVMIGRPPQVFHMSEDELPHVGVKAALFSFTRLRGADPVLGVEMASTGEVGCVAGSLEEAILLAFESSKISPPQKGLLISAGPEKTKLKFLSSAKLLMEMKVPLFATEGTAKYLSQRGIKVTSLPWPSKDGHHVEEKDVIWAIKSSLVDFVVNIPKSYKKEELTNGWRIRQAAVAFNCSLITDMEKATSYIKALAYIPDFINTHEPKALLSWQRD